eukprot:3356290-Amphidinium_carterae.2
MPTRPRVGMHRTPFEHQCAWRPEGKRDSKLYRRSGKSRKLHHKSHKQTFCNRWNKSLGFQSMALDMRREVAFFCDKSVVFVHVRFRVAILGNGKLDSVFDCLLASFRTKPSIFLLASISFRACCSWGLGAFFLRRPPGVRPL